MTPKPYWYLPLSLFFSFHTTLFPVCWSWASSLTSVLSPCYSQRYQVAAGLELEPRPPDFQLHFVPRSDPVMIWENSKLCS